MSFDRIFWLAVFLYLVTALPFYVVDSVNMKKCNEVCVQLGYDKVIKVNGFFPPLECYCFEKFTGVFGWVALS